MKQRMEQRTEQNMEQGVEGMEQTTEESKEERVEDVLVKLGEEVILDCEASQRYANTMKCFSLPTVPIPHQKKIVARSQIL